MYGISHAADRGYAMAAALSYWVFKCRDRRTSPANGAKTWTFLESAIRNSAEVSTTLEDYLQRLATSLQAHLRPSVLTEIIRPQMRVFRVKSDLSEIQELERDQSDLQFMGWRDLLHDARQDGYSEWDILELCRTKAGILQVLCRLRFEEDRAIGAETPDEILEVEATSV